MIQSPDVTDAGLARLGSLKELRTLDLACPALTDRGLAAMLSDMRHLRDVQIEGGRLTEASLQSLDRLPELRHLTTCRNGITTPALLDFVRRHPDVSLVNGPGGPLTATGRTVP
jgi:hypothetical protein